MLKKVVKYGIGKERANKGKHYVLLTSNEYWYHCSLLVTVLHSIYNVADVPLKTVHFLQAGFDRNGERLLGVDQRGNVYVFDLVRNKYDNCQSHTN